MRSDQSETYLHDSLNDVEQSQDISADQADVSKSASIPQLRVTTGNTLSVNVPDAMYSPLIPSAGSIFSSTYSFSDSEFDDWDSINNCEADPFEDLIAEVNAVSSGNTLQVVASPRELKSPGSMHRQLSRRKGRQSSAVTFFSRTTPRRSRFSFNEHLTVPPIRE